MKGRAAAVALLAALGGGCGEPADAVATGATDAATGARCVATGVADGSWLTADWDDSVSPLNCAAVPSELRDATTPGRYVGGEGTIIGEIRCEGLRPGPAAVRVRMRVRLLAATGSELGRCHCSSGWRVGLRVLIDGAETRALDGLTMGGVTMDESCRRGPEVTQTIGVTVGADGRVRARVELGQCLRAGATACVFLRGTGVSVVQ